MRTSLAALCLSLSVCAAAPTRHVTEKSLVSPLDAGVEFFERKIRPVLVEHCYECHSAEAKKPKGRLRLDSRDGLLQGGVSGPALIPGKPADSLLLKAVRYHEDRKMPPRGKLPDDVIADLEKWIA